METRKITVVETKGQKKTVIESAATTLGELKTDLRQNNIDYTGMTFYEGTSKVELKDDTSVLPHDVPWKGTTTNELVIMLTNSNKKIKSGATITTRKEAGEFFKANLSKAVEFKAAHGGKNWTNCSTVDILKFINGSFPKATTSKKEVKTTVENKVETPKAESVEVVDVKCRAALQRLLAILEDNEGIEAYQKVEVLDILGENIYVEESKDSKSESPYSNSEIDHMFDFVK